jgi:hypothetical protein
MPTKILSQDICIDSELERGLCGLKPPCFYDKCGVVWSSILGLTRGLCVLRCRFWTNLIFLGHYVQRTVNKIQGRNAQGRKVNSGTPQRYKISCLRLNGSSLGFQIIGPEERVCQASGLWSNHEPYCKRRGKNALKGTVARGFLP